MKNMYKLFVLCCFIADYHVQAAVYTLSNIQGAIADFETIEEALAGTLDGDIILVGASARSYGNFTLNKRLTLIGSGHNTDNGSGLVSQFESIVLDTGSSGSEIIGFRINYLGRGNQNILIEDINIQRNFIQGGVSLGNVRQSIIQENVLNDINISTQRFTSEIILIVRNNIILDNIIVSNSIFRNNVFLARNRLFELDLTEFNSFTNNIFFQNRLNLEFIEGTIRNNTFNNNIFFGSNNPTSLPAENGNTGQDNIFADPQFVNVPNNNFSYNHDFSLQGSSPGINSGNDHTDIGLFGGIGYSVSGQPAIPQVTLFNILNPLVPQNGNLNVRIEGRANN
jgi:hypothetical protein